MLTVKEKCQLFCPKARCVRRAPGIHQILGDKRIPVTVHCSAAHAWCAAWDKLKQEAFECLRQQYGTRPVETTHGVKIPGLYVYLSWKDVEVWWHWSQRPVSFLDYYITL
ncbi:MAG: hypothetical protein JSS66_05545 [Armatimonadetes bacterium]|nr:hypothetical protein [Armatimonadota bacterium]